MVRVLIVAKTKMASRICIGGLTRDTNANVRLIPPGRSNHPIDTNFDVGQVWDVEFHQASELTPPHMEDVIVTAEQYVAQVSNVREVLMQRVHPWQGGPEQLFDGLLTSNNKSAYLPKYATPSSTCSTGFWLPDVPLKQAKNPDYYIVQVNPDTRDKAGFHDEELYIKYVGFSPTIPQIPANTFLRVSLARWWTPDGANEQRCSLQLSGWYL